jgi:peptidoglycan/xylan/chitin deacetylase (PgdA/CDA1 family)
VARLADSDDAAPEQTPANLGQPGPHVVVPAHRPRPPGQGQDPLRGDREYPRAPDGFLKRPEVVGPQFDVGVDVDARIVASGLVTGFERGALGSGPDGEHPDRRPEASRDPCGIVGAPIGHHDHVEFAGARGGHQLTEQSADDLSLVVRGNDNTDHTGEYGRRASRRASRAAGSGVNEPDEPDEGETMPGQAQAEVISLCFHGIGPPAPGVRPEDEGYFISRDLFLAVLDEVVGRPEVELSFDDGYASDVEIALPAIIQRGLSARFFPLAGQLGRPGYLDAGGVRELSSADMTVGTHGMRHRSWRRMDKPAQHEELTVARELLAEAAGIPVRTAACPFGAYDRGVLAALRERGYVQVFTSDRRRAREGAWLQPRYSVRRDDTVRLVRDDVLAPRPAAERVRCAAVGRIKAWR